MKPGGGVTCQTTSNSLVGKGGSDWVADTLDSLVEGVKPAFPQNSDYEASISGLSIKGESGQWQLWVWRGVAPSPNQGTGLVASSLQWVPCLLHCGFLHKGLADVGWAPLGVASLGGIMGGSSRRATPLNTSSSEKET